MALGLRLHPGFKVKGEGFLPPYQAAQNPGIRCQSFRPDWARAALSPWPSRTCPARPGRHHPRPDAGSGDGAHLVPTHLLWTWLTQQEPQLEGGGDTRQGVGRKSPPKRTPAPRARRGEPAGARGRLPQDTWASARPAGGTQDCWGPAAGRGSADSPRPALGGARLPRAAGPTGSRGRRGRAAGFAAAPGRAFVPGRGGACSEGLRLPLPQPGFLI